MLTGYVSRYFTWAEVIGSSTAARRSIDNTPPEALREGIVATAYAMDRVRRLLDAPVIVSSWYRSLELNRAIGSRDTSAHLTGRAVDFRAPQYAPPAMVFDYLRPLMADLGVDQLILEFPDTPHPWVHIAFAGTPRHMALVIDGGGTRLA
jgi:putative chitinase